MSYEDMGVWHDVHDLILNRCAIINQIHGCAYDWCYGNPCTVRYSRGWYECVYCGNVIDRPAGYHVDSADMAYSQIDGLCDALWLVSSAGMLRAAT